MSGAGSRDVQAPAGPHESSHRERRAFFTIGHSTRSIDEFTALLREAGVETVADVRKMPRSRANPQFNIDVLPDELGNRQVGYRHIAALGGLRGRSADMPTSPNTLWRNRSFRNYADYALTPPFRAGLTELIQLGQARTCAIMCSEVLWWRCHRRIIADYLLADGATVFHVLGSNDIQPAVLTDGARRVAGGLVYGTPDTLASR
ncbi:MAG TPA: DUF488 domain-containing protein [Phenylobacterium sp.]|uniref:DUF488 domain-containing protein n=1 Tax=Phenylobacterium sp. TaxID=1871053 RepID=UPI002C563885|nr:DUF488 domain-containing protein [Phenylobacterium sp.]HSV03241.1 DUF488 domain-containing protein [Phenylobacterium sp.]